MASKRSNIARDESGPSLWKRARYRFDDALSKGIRPVVGLLGAGTFLVVVAAGLLLHIAPIRINGRHPSGIEGFWLSLVRTLDPGTMGSDVGWVFRLTSLVVTICGIFIVSTLIGLLASGIERYLSDLRRGQSEVLEVGHTLVLGWSPKLFLLLAELESGCEGNERATVVVLADRDKVEMEDEIRSAISTSTHLKVIVRSGHPADPRAIERVAPNAARAVIVLRADDGGDAVTTRSVLALESAGVGPNVPVVVEFFRPKHTTALMAATDLQVHVIVVEDWVARITARVARFPSLSLVYQDLLDFDGSEVYFKDVSPDLLGASLADVVAGSSGIAVFGLVRHGEILLAPDGAIVVQQGDRLVALAETGTSGMLGRSSADESQKGSSLTNRPVVVDPQEIAVIGWSGLGEEILADLALDLPLGSRVHVVSSDPAHIERLSTWSHPKLEVVPRLGSETDPVELRSLFGAYDIDRVVLLADRSRRSPTDADAHVLLTLLELRHMPDAPGAKRIVAELIDPRSLALVQQDVNEVFIVGERLVCLLMAQISQDSRRAGVLHAIFSADGPDVVAIDSAAVLGSATWRYGDLARTLLAEGAYLLGYRVDGRIVLNPPADAEMHRDHVSELVALQRN